METAIVGKTYTQWALGEIGRYGSDAPDSWKREVVPFRALQTAFPDSLRVIDTNPDIFEAAGEWARPLAPICRIELTKGELFIVPVEAGKYMVTLRKGAAIPECEIGPLIKPMDCLRLGEKSTRLVVKISSFLESEYEDGANTFTVAVDNPFSMVALAWHLGCLCAAD